MSVKLLTEHHLEYLSLKGGCTGSSESTHVVLLEITFHGSYVVSAYGSYHLSAFSLSGRVILINHNFPIILIATF